MDQRDGPLVQRPELGRHVELIELATRAVQRDERISAAWLAGSLATTSNLFVVRGRALAEKTGKTGPWSLRRRRDGTSSER